MELGQIGKFRGLYVSCSIRVFGDEPVINYDFYRGPEWAAPLCPLEASAGSPNHQAHKSAAQP